MFYCVPEVPTNTASTMNIDEVNFTTPIGQIKFGTSRMSRMYLINLREKTRREPETNYALVKRLERRRFSIHDAEVDPTSHSDLRDRTIKAFSTGKLRYNEKVIYTTWNDIPRKFLFKNGQLLEWHGAKTSLSACGEHLNQVELHQATSMRRLLSKNRKLEDIDQEAFEKELFPNQGDIPCNVNRLNYCVDKARCCLKKKIVPDTTKLVIESIGHIIFEIMILLAAEKAHNEILSKYIQHRYESAQSLVTRLKRWICRSSCVAEIREESSINAARIICTFLDNTRLNYIAVKMIKNSELEIETEGGKSMWLS